MFGFTLFYKQTQHITGNIPLLCWDGDNVSFSNYN